jgi:cysteinyl-tRNA synthetase
VLNDFDAVFDVLGDHDTDATRRALAWAEEAGRSAEVAPEMLAGLALSDEEIEKLVEERAKAKKMRNFARADEIRNELAEKGVILEDSKDGVRWKRK